MPHRKRQLRMRQLQPVLLPENHLHSSMDRQKGQVMNIRNEIAQMMYELNTNENLYPELDKAFSDASDLCEKFFPEEKADDYMNALCSLEHKAFKVGANMVLDFLTGKEV